MDWTRGGGRKGEESAYLGQWMDGERPSTATEFARWVPFLSQSSYSISLHFASKRRNAGVQGTTGTPPLLVADRTNTMRAIQFKTIYFPPRQDSACCSAPSWHDICIAMYIPPLYTFSLSPCFLFKLNVCGSNIHSISPASRAFFPSSSP